MMGFSNMMISFVISYIAGNVPQIKECLESKKDLQDKIDKCFDRALEKWSVNDGVREIEKRKKTFHLEKLKQTIAGEAILDKNYSELVRLWMVELRNDQACYNFILEHRVELLQIKIDSRFSLLTQQLEEGVEEFRDFRRENRDQYLSMMQELQKISTSLGNITEEDLTRKLLKLFNGVVAQMVESLRVISAKELLDEIYKEFHELIEKRPDLHAEYLIAMGRSLTFSNHKEANKLFHQAYQLKPDEKKLIEMELMSLRNNDLEKAFRLSKQLPTNNIMRRVLEVCYSDDIEKEYHNLPEEILNDYTLRYYILQISSEKHFDPNFLFDDVEVKVPDSLTYQNVFCWMYVMTWHTIQFGGELCLSIQQPVPAVLQTAFETCKKLMFLLEETEVRPFFTMVEAHYCYWGFVINRDESWIEAIHQIDRKTAKGQATNLNMMEVSMLTVAGRSTEAFQIVASMRTQITPKIADYVILMAYHAKDMTMLEWVMKLIKEKPFKLSSSAALHIAFCVNGKSASSILRMIDDSLFEMENDAVVLRELCNVYDSRTVDVTALKQHLDKLTGDMTAYAALVLANSGEAQMAYDLLQPRAADEKSGLRQRVLLEVMARLPEKHPELYQMLVNKRKKGERCDDEMLRLEYTLDAQVGDYENAYEVICKLYEHHPTNEDILVNYLRMLGRFDTSVLKGKQQEVLDFKFSQFASIQQVYQIYVENKFFDIAIELLYQFVNASVDVNARTFYFTETTIGDIRKIVNQNYPLATDGLYAICDRADGVRFFFQVGLGSELGEKLIGMKEGDFFECTEKDEETGYVLSHIVNKYGKLTAEISQEIATGNNPYIKVLNIDMDNPLDSLREQIAKVCPNTVDYHKNKCFAEEQYEKGELGILSFVSDDDLIGCYYNRLFSNSKVFVPPYQVLEGIAFQGVSPTSLRYVLDITGLLMLFEYHQKTEYEYNEKFLIASTTYEFVVTSCKNSGRFAQRGYRNAVNGKALARYKNYIDLDLEIRLNKLLKWMDDNCEKVISDKFLTFDGREKKSISQVLIMNTLMLLTQPDRCLISDDLIIEKILRMKARVITTETYMRSVVGGEDGEKFLEFLTDCNYIGVFINRDYIYDEYLKMERGMENQFNYVTQNVAYNEILPAIVVQAAIKIAENAKDRQLARITLTNLFVVMIAAIRTLQRSAIVANLTATLPEEYRNTMFVRRCLEDAARINHVIILPSGM